jgi:hypothetical protein
MAAVIEDAAQQQGLRLGPRRLVIVHLLVQPGLDGIEQVPINTQQFNTTTSMGRLTLNVLLSFAQFEREVTSERIRDKIAASKRKGLWVGGMAPLGYDTKNRKITVNEPEAERVRTIFQRYLELRSLHRLMANLRERGIVTKLRTLKSGHTVGGIPFTRGPLAYLLRNRFYVGEVLFKGETLVGEQPAIELIADPTANAESISAREGCSVRQVNMTISLAFLAPDFVKAAIDGRLPHGMGVTRLRDLPPEWSRQQKMLGL